MDLALHSIRLDKSIPIPLYYQLKKQILDLIESAELKAGDMLPAENDLCELLQVSRPTIRQAFRELMNEGYLTRFKGKGTFVATPKVKDRFLSTLGSFNQEMLDKGMTPHTTVLALEKIAGNPEYNEMLQLPIDEPLIRLERLRCADRICMVYVETFLSYKQYAELLEIDFSTQSLYETLERLYHVRVSHARREIEAVGARRREAELLNISHNQALCLVNTIAFADGVSLPVEYSIARYRGDMTKFSVEIYH